MPTKYGHGVNKKIEVTDFPDGWEDSVMELASEGASLTEIANILCVKRTNGKSLPISIDTVYKMINRDEYFREIMQAAAQAYRGWWEKQGRTNLENRDFSTSLYQTNMTNRFGWRNSAARGGDDEGKITVDNRMIERLEQHGVEVRAIIEQTGDSEEG